MRICHYSSIRTKCILLSISFVGLFLILKAVTSYSMYVRRTFLQAVHMYLPLTDNNYQQNINELTKSHNMKILPCIYIVTPTYNRPTQMAELTRLAQTLLLIQEIMWIVVEDANHTSKRVTKLLNRTGIRHVQLATLTPTDRRSMKYGRGVATRRKALDWLRENVEGDGVLYFADDDNAYDIRVFEEMRWTKTVSVWPVGLIWKFGISSPVVRDGHVVQFHDSYVARRTFIMDMAGFAINMNLFLEHPNATMDYKLGGLEDGFLKGLDITIDDLEPKANNCTQVLVWHTKTHSGRGPSEKNKYLVANFTETNIPELYRNILT